MPYPKLLIPIIVAVSAITIGGAAVAYNISKPKESLMTQSSKPITSLTENKIVSSTLSTNSKSSSSILNSSSNSSMSSSSDQTKKSEPKVELETEPKNQNLAVTQEVERLNAGAKEIILTKSKVEKNKPFCSPKTFPDDDYGKIEYTDKGCFNFSTRSMCDFDNNSQAIIELKQDLIDEAKYQFNKFADKIVDEVKSVNMACRYTRLDNFKFSFLIPDRDFIFQKTGESPHGSADRIIIKFEAKKEDGIWTLYEKESIDIYENWKPYEYKAIPTCPFTKTNRERFEYLVNSEIGCFNLNIYNRIENPTDKINHLFEFSVIPLEDISREYFSKIASELNVTKEVYLSVDNLKFNPDATKAEFSIDTFGSYNNDPTIKSKYIKYYTVEEKVPYVWEVVSIR